MMVVAILIAVLSLVVMVWRVRFPLKKFWPRLLQKIISLFGLVSLVGVVGWFVMVNMPGDSFRGAPPELVDERSEMRSRLESDVVHLAVEIGERNVHCDSRGLMAATAFVESRFSELGYEPQRQEFKVGGVPCANIEVEIAGTTLANEIVVIGAHYDSAPGTPGAMIMLAGRRLCWNWRGIFATGNHSGHYAGRVYQ